MKKITLSLLLAWLALVGLVACVDTSRDPETSASGLPDIYNVELWSEHRYYEFGEPVNLRATLTNVSEYTLTFGSESGTTPIIDLTIKDFPATATPDERMWSQENLDKVKYLVVLSPGESYVITWALSLSIQTKYLIDIQWMDPFGHPPQSNLEPGRIGSLRNSIYHGLRPPGGPP